MSNEIPSTMRKTVTVPLDTPVTWFSKTISEVVLEEPTAHDFFELGEPTTPVFSAGGKGGTVVDIPAALFAYLARCAKVEQADVFIRHVSLRDGQALKRALLGFFHPAEEISSA